MASHRNSPFQQKIEIHFRFVGSLSGGERVKLSMARLLLERPTLAEEREPPPDGLETLEEERLAPPPYEERPALEDRETEPAEDDPRLTEEDDERPPPPLD